VSTNDAAQFADSNHGAAPDFYEPLRVHAPWAYEAILGMRRRSLADTDAGGALSTLHKEYVLIALDIALRNEAGVRQHTRDAMRAGATLEGIIEIVVLVMLTAGAVTYRTSGYAAMEEAAKAGAADKADNGND
jgi:alkylhydroperoxidase/carboxymuconolactone decarboxylase family protein YurZ